MCQKDSEKSSEKQSKDPILEALYTYHSLDGTIPTVEEFEERARKGIEEIEERERAREAARNSPKEPSEE